MAFPREDTAKHKMEPWDVEDVVRETIDGEHRMRDLETREFIKTFRRMVCFPKAPKGIKLSRGDGSPFFLDFFTVNQLKALKKKFQMKKSCTMKKEELYAWMKKNIRHLKMEDQHFDKIFNLMDLDLDGIISLEELMSYLDMEIFDKHHLVNGYFPSIAADYIKGPILEISETHNHVISSLLYWPSVNQNRQIERFVGKYITANEIGEVEVFNLDFKKLYSLKADLGTPERLKTYVSRACILPEIGILCLSTMERSLCFYDISHEKVELVYKIYNYENSITALVYKFYEDKRKKSFIAIGDSHGSVMVLLFKTGDGGPFKKIPGQPVTSVRWCHILMDGVPDLEVRPFRGIHTRWVESIKFSDGLNCLISCSHSCPMSLLLLDVANLTVLQQIDIPQGISCADVLPLPPEMSMLAITGYDEPQKPEIKLFDKWIVTGGIDTLLRVWDLNDTRKARYILSGHISRIKFIIVQYNQANFPLIVAIGRRGRISVWNGLNLSFIQLYVSGFGELAETKPVAVCYNADFQLLILASYKMLGIKLGEHRDKNISAGLSHQTEITNLLYNTIYHVLISTSTSSAIVRWDPFKGIRELVIAEAHKENLMYGQRIFGITVATFNQEQNLLATGATNGSIKIWDFYRGIPLRELESNGTVSHILWLRSRIMAVNYSKRIRVWENTLKYDSNYKDLSTINQYAISAIVFVEPSFVVIGTVGGELHFCDAGSGLPIKRFLVQNPSKNLRLHSDYEAALQNEETQNIRFNSSQYEQCGGSGKIEVNLLYFLGARPVKPDVGNLVASLGTGVLQFYSSHPEGGFISSFYALHWSHDNITTITSDKENRYLFTGTSQGYLKLWLLTDFALPNGQRPPMAVLRLQFCFLVRENVMGQAKRVAIAEPGPLLLNCYRAHTTAITGTLFMNSCEMVVTCGGDRCIRYWTLSGQFVNSLDSLLSWMPIDPCKPIKMTEFRIPTDLRRILSSTTLKVLTRDYRCLEMGDEVPEIEDDTDRWKIDGRTTSRKPFGTSLTLDSLANYFNQPEPPPPVLTPLPDLDDNLVCVLKNIPLLKTEKVKWIKPPKIIRSKRKRLEHGVLWKDRKTCYECKEEEKIVHGGKELPYKEGLTLEKGIKLKKRAKKESEKKKAKFTWKSHKKEYKEPIGHPLSSKVFGKSIDGMTDALGELMKGVEVPLDEYTFFGYKVPKSRKEQNKFLQQFLKDMKIEDSPTSRQMIKDAMEVEKRRTVEKNINALLAEDKEEILNFDCFTEKEKKEILEKRMKKAELREGVGGTGETHAPGVESVIADCLYETKFMELSDNELINFLHHLTKPINSGEESDNPLAGYKKRLQWWMEQSGRKKSICTTGLNLTQDSPLRIFVRSLLNEQDDSIDITKEGQVYDHAISYVKEILRNEPCPACGKTEECGQSFKSHSKTFSQSRIPKKTSEVKKGKMFSRKPLLSILKSCLLKVDLGNVKEENAESKLSDFLLDVVKKCVPICKLCNKTGAEDSKNTIANVQNLMETIKVVNEFRKPKQFAYEKKLSQSFKRTKLFKSRNEENSLIDLENAFHEMKKINLAKLNEKLVGLDNEYVRIRGFSESDKEKRRQIREEIDSVKARIEEEEKRTLE